MLADYSMETKLQVVYWMNLDMLELVRGATDEKLCEAFG